MKICRNCGADNKENSKFCIRCGKQLEGIATGPNLTPQATSLNLTPQATSLNLTPQHSKSVGIAIILNFFIIWGLGYRYLGVKKVFGQPWYLLSVIAILYSFVLIMTNYNLLLLFPSFLFNVALAYDLSQKVNQKPGFVPVEY